MVDRLQHDRPKNDYYLSNDVGEEHHNYFPRSRRGSGQNYEHSQNEFRYEHQQQQRSHCYESYESGQHLSAHRYNNSYASDAYEYEYDDDHNDSYDRDMGYSSSMLHQQSYRFPSTSTNSYRHRRPSMNSSFHGTSNHRRPSTNVSMGSSISRRPSTNNTGGMTFSSSHSTSSSLRTSSYRRPSVSSDFGYNNDTNTYRRPSMSRNSNQYDNGPDRLNMSSNSFYHPNSGDRLPSGSTCITNDGRRPSMNRSDANTDGTYRNSRSAYYDDTDATQQQEIQRCYQRRNSNGKTKFWERIMVEIVPGTSVPMHGSAETECALREGRTRFLICVQCDTNIVCINESSLVICPCCRSILPTGLKDGKSYNVDKHPLKGKDSLGLGVNAKELQY